VKRIFLQIWHIASPADRVIIIATFLLASGSFFFFRSGNDDRTEVWISVNNRLKYRVLLSQDRELSVQGQLGTVDIRIQDKKVWVTKSSCPHKICMRMGKISKAGQMIVCVPNQVVITLRSCHKNLNLDVITQ